jgi:hypothetical protein
MIRCTRTDINFRSSHTGDTRSITKRSKNSQVQWQQSPTQPEKTRRVCIATRLFISIYSCYRCVFLPRIQLKSLPARLGFAIKILPNAIKMTTKF